MISGYRLRPEFVLVLFHPHARSVEGDAFRLEPQPLFQAVFARERDLPFRAYHTMPRQPAGPSQCPNHLTGAAGKARRARDVAVGRYFASRDFANGVADDFKHDALLSCPSSLLKVGRSPRTAPDPLVRLGRARPPYIDRSLLCAIPGQCPAQPVFERIFRIVTQIATGRGSVGLRIANIASPWRTIACG
jgi:hypothetical protein